jgi:hypothetical protein
MTGSVSHYYHLEIVVPRAYILGADEYYSKAGGDISLVCIIEDVSIIFYNVLLLTVSRSLLKLICLLLPFQLRRTNVLMHNRLLSSYPGKVKL